ncbi:MAG: hypothetical protein LUC34_06850 [Campylobacter sp.]|nr:hypothetical protein [Campylobacter sp.]
MQLIGHALISYEPIFWAQNKSEILNERQNLFVYNAAMVKYAKEINAEFSVVCDNIAEAVIANAAEAKFIVCHTDVAKKFADLAQFYLFDSKIACIIKDESDLEVLANLGVDAAIFRQGVIGGNF